MDENERERESERNGNKNDIETSSGTGSGYVIRSTRVRHKCTRSKVHGRRLMISKYGSAVWSPHSAEVYIGFESASSCPRLISPTAACLLYIHARGFPVNGGLTCAFSRFTRITFGNGGIAKRGPSQDHVWQGTRRDVESTPADRAESASRFSTLGLRPWTRMLGTAKPSPLEHALYIWKRLRTMNILAL